KLANSRQFTTRSRSGGISCNIRIRSWQTFPERRWGSAASSRNVVVPNEVENLLSADDMAFPPSSVPPLLWGTVGPRCSKNSKISKELQSHRQEKLFWERPVPKM